MSSSVCASSSSPPPAHESEEEGKTVCEFGFPVALTNTLDRDLRFLDAVALATRPCASVEELTLQSVLPLLQGLAALRTSDPLPVDVDVCVSGGASGADAVWAGCAARAGHIVLEMSFSGHHSAPSLTPQPLTRTQANHIKVLFLTSRKEFESECVFCV